MPFINSNWSSVIEFEHDAQRWPRIETEILIAGDETAYDEFGSSVSISDDGMTMVIGAMYDDDPSVDSGSAYVFTYNGIYWEQQAKLTPSSLSVDDLFGSTVKVTSTGDTIFVAAPNDDTLGTDAGAVYVFKSIDGIWTETEKLTAPDGQAGDHFGFSIDCNVIGSSVIIGIDNVLVIGAAYVYRQDGATLSAVQKIVPNDGAVGDQFGYSVTMDQTGEQIAIGAPKHDASARGAVYYMTLVELTTWTHRFKLIPPTGGAYNGCFFGEGLKSNADFTTFVVGAPGKDSNKGEVLVYTRTGYSLSLEATLTPSDYSTNHNFGYVVDINDFGDCVTVSSTVENGAVYVFVKLEGVWVECEKLVGTGTSSSLYFGSSHSLSARGYRLCTGTDNISTGLTSAGAVHIFN